MSLKSKMFIGAEGIFVFEGSRIAYMSKKNFSQECVVSFSGFFCSTDALNLALAALFMLLGQESFLFFALFTPVHYDNVQFFFICLSHRKSGDST